MISKKERNMENKAVVADGAASLHQKKKRVGKKGKPLKYELFHSENLNLSGSSISRNAVRGVISDNTKLLLIYSPVNGDYKFPGGGIEISETHDSALKREVREECGLELASINAFLGIITEYNTPHEEELDVFVMQSFYYLCSIGDSRYQNQNLDDYEKELEFTPRWIELEEAINVNQNLMKTSSDFPGWTKRDTFFLNYLAENKSLLFPD